MAYGVMRCLSLTHGVASKKLPVAQQALVQHGLAASEAPSRDHDQRLLQACEQAGDTGAFLCLRCRVSWPLEQLVRNLHSQNERNYGVELIALAAIALDDTGRMLPVRPPEERDGRKLPTEPFGVAVIRSYKPERSGLGRWARQKLMGHRPLQDYLREHGVRLLKDWALLADTSQRRVVGAVSRLDGTLPPERAAALHRRYLPLYRQAKLIHIQREGRQQGWEPDDAFLLALEPDQPPRQTRELLERIAKAVRLLESGRWLKQESALLDGDGASRPLSSSQSKWEAHEGAGIGDLVIGKLVEEVGLEYITALLKPLQRGGLEQRIWQAWSQGLRQRQIAERCSTREAPVSQARVSRVVNEKIHAGQIATLVLDRLRRNQSEQRTAEWAGLFGSVERLKQAEQRLMNHLLMPEQEGIISPLRRWVQHALHSCIAPASAEPGSGEWG
jgi:predicted XRE-type DNA-binding protein